jgi:hypothetical protein
MLMLDISGRKILKYILLLTVVFCYFCNDLSTARRENGYCRFFSGAAMRQCTLTYDLQTLKMFLQSIETK